MAFEAGIVLLRKFLEEPFYAKKNELNELNEIKSNRF
jgi:hypothetical protein